MSQSGTPFRFYGRESELNLLRQFQSDVHNKGISRFVVVTERRLVGKTWLLEIALPLFLKEISSTERLPFCNHALPRQETSSN